MKAWMAQGAVAAAGAALAPSLIPALCRRGAPYVPTAREKIDFLFGRSGVLLDSDVHSWLSPCQRARGVADLRFVDLGSGGGVMLRAASGAGYKSATGFEVNPGLALCSAARGGRGVSTRWQSLWEAPLDDADVVLVFGCPPIMSALGAKLRSELRDGVTVVSNAYPLPPRWLGSPVSAAFVETAGWSRYLYSDVSSSLFCYRQTAEAEAEAVLERRVPSSVEGGPRT